MVATVAASLWIYSTAPLAPDPAHGRIFALSNHGTLVYVTERQLLVESYLPFVAGVVFFCAIGLHRWDRKRRGIVEPPRPDTPRRIDGTPLPGGRDSKGARGSRP
jgi:hypothetical protein